MTTDTAVAPDETAVQPELELEVETPETNPVEQTPETPPRSAPPEEPVEVDINGLLAKLDDKDLEALEPVKSLINRQRESARRTTEHEVARRSAAERETWAQSGQWTADLAAAVTLNPDGTPQVDSRKVNSVANGLLAFSVHNSMTAIGQVVDSIVSRDMKVPREVQTEIEDATRDFMVNPVQGKDRLVKSWMAVVAQDAVDKATPDIIKKARRDWEKEREVAEKARAVAAADAAPNGTATRVAGGGSAGALNIQNWDDAAEAFADKKITRQQYGEYRKKFGKDR